MATAVPGSQWTIASGYRASEDAEIHRLSEIVLKLAATNFMVNFLIRTVVMIINTSQKGGNTSYDVLSWLFWVTFSCYVYRIGIQGVKSRNAPCGGGCCSDSGCGYLTVFFGVYVFFASLHGIAVLVFLAAAMYGSMFVSLFFLILTGSTAEYARRLLDHLSTLGSTARRRDIEAATAAPPVPVAAATEVELASATAQPIPVDQQPGAPIVVSAVAVPAGGAGQDDAAAAKAAGSTATL